MSDLHITSTANPRIKSLIALRRRRVRDAQGITLLEGYAEAALALEAGVRPRLLLVCEELAAPGRTAADLVETVRSGGGEIIHLSRSVFEKVAYREGPDGILAVVPSPVRTLDELALPAEALVLLSEGVEKPGNLGAMLRTADAAGVAAVIAADPATDWGNPNVIRGSKGTVFSVPVAAAPGPEALAYLDRAGVALVATTPDTDTDYTEVDYTGPIAVAVGTEKTGLTDAVLAAARHRVRIPMAGRADSLNVATSAAIVLYEAVRQRRLRNEGITSGQSRG